MTSAPYVLLSPDHPLTTRKAVTLQQLVDEPLILFDLPPGGEYFLSIFAEADLQPRVRFRTTSYELVRSLVARGLGYSILSQRTRIETSYEGLPYQVRELKGKHPGLTVHAVTLGDVPQTRRAQAFVAQCRKLLDTDHSLTWRIRQHHRRQHDVHSRRCDAGGLADACPHRLVSSARSRHSSRPKPFAPRYPRQLPRTTRRLAARHRD